ncbi:hypothetical protein ACWC98_35520 [Streptomyces goshikiensis]|uniref:hypothetical protein n=1 Tax=Streptomyces goshikiensis TaxID=1942 RepID=UPI0036C9DD6F
MIWLNHAYLLSASIQQMIAAHELGHALGFCHKDYRKYTTLTVQDKKNYTALRG